MAVEYEADARLRLAQGFQHGEITLAGNAKTGIDAMFQKRRNQCLSAVHWYEFSASKARLRKSGYATAGDGKDVTGKRFLGELCVA